MTKMKFKNEFEYHYTCPSFTTGTIAPTTLPPSPEETIMVKFFGLEVSAPDAEVALYVLLALTLVGVITAALITYRFIKSKKQTKDSIQENINLEKRF